MCWPPADKLVQSFIVKQYINVLSVALNCSKFTITTTCLRQYVYMYLLKDRLQISLRILSELSELINLFISPDDFRGS